MSQEVGIRMVTASWDATGEEQGFRALDGPEGKRTVGGRPLGFAGPLKVGLTPKQLLITFKRRMFF